MSVGGIMEETDLVKVELKSLLKREALLESELPLIELR